MIDSIQKAKLLIESVRFDLAIVDLHLPDGSGFEFCEKVKSFSQHRTIPTLLLTASNETTDKVTGFYFGIWDYMTKPINSVELNIRVKSILEKSRSQTIQSSLISVGDLTLNLKKFDARIRTDHGEEIVDLTPIEFRILKTLMDNRDSILTRETIIQNVWKRENQKSLNRALDVHIANIRKKFGVCGRQIKSIYGVGYTIENQFQ